MESSQHELSELFAQLGLPNHEAAINDFIAKHVLPRDARLPDATFWSPAQAQFLREAWRQDADWAVLIDQLSIHLQH